MAAITLQGTDKRWLCATDDTVARAALRAGLGFPYECNVGSCGTCRFVLVEGEVEQIRPDPPALNERDKLRGVRLGCQARPLTDCTVKLRLMPRYAGPIPPVRQQAVLAGTCDITHDIREFRLRLVEEPVPFLPGQYALLEVPAVAGARPYSMSNASVDDGEWQFFIRRVPGGQVTKWLFDELRVGDKVELDGPYGMAYLREDSARDIICLAGGSGLSPMISIARAAMFSPSLNGLKLDFVYGGRTARDICGRDLLEALPGFGSRIQFHPVVSASEEPEDGWNGHHGFVHDVVPQLLGERLPNSEIYFAGPPAMGEAVQKMLLAHNVPPEQIHFDKFY